MKIQCPTLRAYLFSAVIATTLTGPGRAADSKKGNPASKVYFSEVQGEAQIDTGDKIEDLTQRSVYTAQGTVIETKKAQTEADKNKYFSTMVYSNGTGAFFDNDTRVEVKRFQQEPFIPTRSDVDVEPSISQTQAYVSRGAVGLCTSKLVAGSNMIYQTPHASVNIRGRRVVIEATSDTTKISVLEGDSTVKAGPNDMGGHTLSAGQQAIIHQGTDGRPNTIEITRIPPQEAPQLDEKVAIACAAKKTVYFEVRERPADSSERLAKDASAADQAAGGTTDQSAGASTGAGRDPTPVTAFDGNSATPTLPVVREIVPVPVVPVELPVQYTISPSTLPAPSPRN